MKEKNLKIKNMDEELNNDKKDEKYLGMTRLGYRNKFKKTFITLTLILVILLFIIDPPFVLWYILLAVVFAFVPSAIIALIWEFFKNPK